MFAKGSSVTYNYIRIILAKWDIFGTNFAQFVQQPKLSSSSFNHQFFKINSSHHFAVVLVLPSLSRVTGFIIHVIRLKITALCHHQKNVRFYFVLKVSIIISMVEHEFIVVLGIPMDKLYRSLDDYITLGNIGKNRGGLCMNICENPFFKALPLI